MSKYSIREILNLVPRGQIKVPAFQRGFVWDPENVALLHRQHIQGIPLRFAPPLADKGTN